MNDRRCFAQWLVLLLGYLTVTVLATYEGLPQLIFHTDVTYMTSVIAVIFVIAVLYLGFASWRFDANGWRHDTLHSEMVHARMLRGIDAMAEADIGLAQKAAYIVTLFGLLGTVIGLQRQVGAMATVTPDNLMPFLAQVSSALGTAFYATGTGIVASIGIIAMAANLEFFLDRNEA